MWWYFSMRQTLMSVKDESMNIYSKNVQSAKFGIYIAESIDTVRKQRFAG